MTTLNALPMTGCSIRASTPVLQILGSHHQMSRFALILLLVIALLGCRREFPPVVSGVVVNSGLFMGQFVMTKPEGQPKSWQLTREQLDHVSDWIRGHESGWDMILVSPPPPSFSIVLKHSNGTNTRIDLFSMNDNWQKVVVVRNSDAGMNGIGNISTKDRNALIEAVKERP